jgi:hypothetical protein
LTLLVKAGDDLTNFKAISAMGVTSVGLATGATNISYANVSAMLAANPNISFTAGTPIVFGNGDLISAATAANLSGLGLQLPAGFPVQASTLTLSDAYSLALKGSTYATGTTDKVQINVNTADSTVSLTQVQKIIAAANGQVNFVGGTLKLTGTDLQSINSTLATTLATDGISQIQLQGTITVAQAAGVLNSALSFKAGTIVSDRNISIANAQTLLAKGVTFSASTLSVPTADALNSLLTVDENGNSIMAALKAAGVTSLQMGTVANPIVVTQTLANVAITLGGLQIAGAQVDATGGLTATGSAAFASLGLAIPPGAALIVTGNAISFGEIYSLASKGVAVVPDTSPGMGNKITVTLASTDVLTLAKATTILNAKPVGAS